MPDRPVPLLGDISLELVRHIEHRLDGGFASMSIAGLDGELQQRTGRPSHRIVLSGMVAGPEAATQLETLQNAAATGDELPFAADITSALELEQVVVSSFRAAESAGLPGVFSYDLVLTESPPLPPPAQLEGFGGLDDFGLGDLGFDTDILGDLADLAGDIAGAVESAMDMVDQLAGLAALATGGFDLDVGAFLAPVEGAVSDLGAIGASLGDAANALKGLFGG